MKLLDRLTSGIVSPKRILYFSEDKKILVFFVLLFQIILLSIPGCLESFLINPLDYASKVDIRESFYQEEIPYEIKNGHLSYTKTKAEDVLYVVNATDYSFAFTRSENVRNVLYKDNNITSVLTASSNEVIIFTEDGIAISLYTMVFYLGSYDEFSSFEGLSFENTKPSDSDFWDVFFEGMNSVYKKYKTTIFVINVTLTILSSAISFILFTLITTAISRLGRLGLIPFGKNYKLIIYYMMPYVLGELFASLTGIRIIMYIGMGYTLFNIFKMNFVVGGSNNE